MERKHRLTRSIDFKRVRRKGTSHAHPLAVLISSRNELAVTRVGVSAAKSIGNAVRRNRTKRRLREALRRQLSRIESGWDVVVIARPDAVVADWDLLCSAVDGLLKQSGLLREPNRDEHEA